MRRVVVLGASQAVRDRVAAVGGFQMEAVSAELAEQDLAGVFAGGKSPDLVILGDQVAEETLVGWVPLLKEADPSLSILLVAAVDYAVEAKVLEAGVAGVVQPTATDAELAAALVRSLEPAPLGGSGVGKDASGRVVVIASPKGGVGKTTFATNFAVALAQRAKLQVVLVDLDAQFGDIASALDLPINHSVVEAVRASGDSVLLKTYLVPHDSGLMVLGASDSPAAADSITADLARNLVNSLARLFPIVIVDTGAGLTEQSLGAMEAADDLIVVSSLDVSALRGIRRELSLLDDLGLRQERHLVVNFDDRKSGMFVKDVESVTGLSASVVLPRDPSVLLSGNQGVPVVLVRKPGEFAKRIKSFSDRWLVNLPNEAGQGHRRRGRRKEKS